MREDDGAMWTTALRRVGLLAMAMLCWSLTATAPAGATVRGAYRESFERDFGGWLPDTDGRARRWHISRSTERAVDGSVSLAYFLDGTLDDGTIWIERTFPTRPYADLTVRVSFWVHSHDASITSWPVVGVAGVKDPEVERDLPVIGRADQRAGWTPHAFTTRVKTGADGVLWVAAGISATWEVVRTYHLDLVEVTVEPATVEPATVTAP